LTANIPNTIWQISFGNLFQEKILQQIGFDAIFIILSILFSI